MPSVSIFARKRLYVRPQFEIEAMTVGAEGSIALRLLVINLKRILNNKIISVIILSIIII